MLGKSHNKKGASGKCLDDEQLYRYLEKLLSKAESRAVQEHLDSCSACFDDMAALARNAYIPASEAEKVELASLPQLSPQEQVGKILDYVETECPPAGSILNESARKALDDSSMLHIIEKSSWQDFWQRVASPRRLPRYAFAVVAFLVFLIGSFIGIPYYQNAASLARVERELRNHYQVYVNVDDFVESAPRLSGRYAHQPTFPMAGEEVPAYLSDSRQRLEKVLSRTAKSVKARQLLTQTFIMRGAYTQADSVLRQIPAASLQEASLLNDQGVLHLATKNLAAAAQDFERAVKIDPKFIEARYNLALIKAKMGATAEAIKILKEYIKLETDEGWRRAVEAILDDLQKKIE